MIGPFSANEKISHKNLIKFTSKITKISYNKFFSSSYIKWNSDNKIGSNRVAHALQFDMQLEFTAIIIDLPTFNQNSSVTWHSSWTITNNCMDTCTHI